MKVVAVSGGFDPVHRGHIEMMKMARKLGDKLVVIVNSDEFLEKKKGYKFMCLEERMRIIEAFECVDEVIKCIDEDMTVCETLRMLKPCIFANGGDRGEGEVPEEKICKELGIELIFGLGEKIQSSSKLVESVKGEI